MTASVPLGGRKHPGLAAREAFGSFACLNFPEDA